MPIYGRVATLQLWRPPGEPQDLLFLTTEREQFCVLAFDERSGELVTRANGELHDRIGRRAEFGQIAIIDPNCRLIALRVYDGLLKLIPVGPAASGSGSAAASAGSGASVLREAFNVRLDELQVIDLCFLHTGGGLYGAGGGLGGGGGKPALAVLYQDAKEARNVKTCVRLAPARRAARVPHGRPPCAHACSTRHIAAASLCSSCPGG